MTYIRASFYLILAACAIVLTLDLHRQMPKVGAALGSVQAIEKSTSDLEEATYASEGEIANLTDTANGIASKLADQEDAELKQAQKASQEFAKLLEDADGAVGHLDASAVQLGTIGATTNQAIAGIAADAHTTLGAGEETLKAATVDLADPSLKAALADAGDAAANASAATKEAAGAMADVHRVTAYEAKQIMAPVTKVKAIALVATRFVGRFFGF